MLKYQYTQRFFRKWRREPDCCANALFWLSFMKPYLKTKPLPVWIIVNVHLGKSQGGGLFKHLNIGLIYAGK